MDYNGILLFRLQQIEAEFFKYVRLKDVSQNLAVDMDIVNLVFSYWKLKRKVDGLLVIYTRIGLFT